MIDIICIHNNKVRRLNVRSEARAVNSAIFHTPIKNILWVKSKSSPTRELNSKSVAYTKRWANEIDYELMV